MTQPLINPRAVFFIVLVATRAGLAADPQRVDVVDAPDGGIQPQAVADSKGGVHLVYLKGDPAKSDVYYARAEPGETSFSRPIRVNGEHGSAIAVGTIRGAQLAVGRTGRVHVAWNGSGQGKVKNPNGGAPMLYARLNDSGAAFEPERNLMTRTNGLDGGGSVAADGDGRVFVAWHGRTSDALGGERARQFFVARSDDDGKTFAHEMPAVDRATGACACCGTRAFVDRRGGLLALYRAATDDVERGMILVASRDHGAHFEEKPLQPWRISTCPMSSESLAEGPGGILAGWETAGRVYFATIDREGLRSTNPISPPGDAAGQKHPALAANERGETIVVWTEGTGWQRGGDLAWQVYDADGKLTETRGRRPHAIPVWGLATVVARADGSFVIIH
jgi:hypothetical protein